TIHTIFNNPNAAPYSRLAKANLPGMPNTKMATRTAVVAPAIAHQCGRTFRPASSPSRTTMGSAATSVESHQWPNGSYTCVHVMNSPPKSANSQTYPVEFSSPGEVQRGKFSTESPELDGSARHPLPSYLFKVKNRVDRRASALYTKLATCHATSD